MDRGEDIRVWLHPTYLSQVLLFSHLDSTIFLHLLWKFLINMTSVSQTPQINNIQASMNADWPSDTDFSCYMVIDDSLVDSIPEAAKLSFEEPEAAELFDESLLLVDSIPEAAELFDEALFLADSIPEAVGLFGEAFFLVDSTTEAAELSFELETAELFEKFCFSDLAPEAAEPSSEFCPQVQSTDVETQDLPTEDSRLTEEASDDPSDNGGPKRYLVGPNAARPLNLGVSGATATDIDKESQNLMV